MSLFFFFSATATPEIYTLSLHDALPIFEQRDESVRIGDRERLEEDGVDDAENRRGRTDTEREREHGDGREHSSSRQGADRKSTRLNSSHMSISYAVFCLKKKKKKKKNQC